jgi:predicted ATPase/DNA-binding SARP family transcriptional activator/tetratricopeptide (TPR) repeat protein
VVSVELRLLSRVAYRDQEVAGPRLRGLLALLAGDLRTGCSSARLVDGLWPHDQPENPTKALQVLVSRARAQLGADLIASTPSGYRLSLSEDQVDTSAVVLSATASARHARAGDHEAALAHAEAGLALYEEAESGDTGYDDPVSALRVERASTRRSLARARALALSRLGRRAEAVEALTGLVTERPRDEEVLLELLRCEAETVGPSAALARYDAYRRSLRDELGSDPGPALQALHRQLLQGEAPAVRHGIPHEPNPLLGRAGDLAAVTNLLRISRVTSIVGPGGLGKTRLAHAVSRQAEQRVVHVVVLAGVTTDDDVASEVASALGVGDPRRASAGHRAIAPDLLTGVVSALGPGPALLVLDNCEQVIKGAAELVRTLVSMTRDLRVLVTSRAPLGLSSESVYLLPELPLATTVELFEQRARAARPGIDLPAKVVEELCGHLDGLPLAVELAAARLRVMSVVEIARRLDDRFALLRGGARDAPERHQTLHAVVDWSWNLLEPAGQAAMRALSVFPGGFTAQAAGQLLGDGDVLPVLEHLVDQSLLKVTDTSSGTRFRMLETVREFSTARREAAGETGRVLDGFLAWARDFGVAHHDAILGADPVSSVALIQAEQDNLVQALRQGLDQADGATVAATAAVLGAAWVFDSNPARMGTLIEETGWILSHYRPEPGFVEVARTVATLFVIYAFFTQGPRAARTLVTLRRLPPAPPTTPIRALATVLSIAPQLLGPDSPELEALCESDEPLLAGVANGIAGFLWENEGDLEAALKRSRRMLESFERRATPWLLVLTHTRISELCAGVEQADEAQRHLKVALGVQEEYGEHADVFGIRWGLVLTSLQLGAIDEAEHWLELAVQGLVDDSGGTLAFELGVRAEILLARAEVEAGLRLWRRVVDQVNVVLSASSGTEPSGLDPWTVEVQAVTVVAHARHGRLDLVEQVTSELPHKLSAILAQLTAGMPRLSVVAFPACGALLLALGIVDLDRGQRGGDDRLTTSGVRMIALAERFRFPRNFQPTMSTARARDAAEQADRSAYADAVSAYADLGREELRAAALAALEERARR